MELKEFAEKIAKYPDDAKIDFSINVVRWVAKNDKFRFEYDHQDRVLTIRQTKYVPF